MAGRAKVNWRTSQGERTVDEILDTASRMMSEQGYDGVSVAALSNEVGVNVSSIYWHFGSKAGLLAALMERGAVRYFAEIDRAMAAPPPLASASERIAWAMAQVVDVVSSHREFLRLLMLLGLHSRDQPTIEGVQRVWAEGRASVYRHLRWALSGEYGQEIAAAIADEIVDFTVVHINGAFLSSEIRADLEFARLVEALVNSQIILSEQAVDRYRSQNP
ncbi:TetR/AcrR family transcriptional regulator [Granulicoccus phenolivorans]|uniref:TetR/AcrR family transcriptional regulator n=1 Tax=Granulicoccus phenolivorans TaxID=266854 RepID=UPI0006863F26|nr:TetR/AcrR family transcriptional regulator [Granulicoccus phenolivorans]